MERNERRGKTAALQERGRKEEREWGGWEVVSEVWKEDSGKVIRFL